MLRDALVPFLLTRGALAAGVAVATAFVPLDVAACQACMPTGIEALDDWARWDSRWYVEIARNGYSYVPGQQSSIAFFPLYPLLLWLLAAPFGGGPVAVVVAGLVVSNAALLVALVLLLRLARPDLDGAAARRVPLLVLAFPTSVFLSAVYPESLFLALAVSGFLAARGGRWATAGIAAALGALTRPFGFAVALGLAVEALRGAPASRPRALAALALTPAALAAWWAYLTALTGEPLAFLVVNATFRRGPSDVLGPLRQLADPAYYGFPYLVGALLALAVILTALAWRLLPAGQAAYATTILVVILGSGTLGSSMRWELALFPIFLVLASLAARRAAVGRAYVALGSALSLLFAAMYARQYWIG